MQLVIYNRRGHEDERLLKHCYASRTWVYIIGLLLVGYLSTEAVVVAHAIFRSDKSIFNVAWFGAIEGREEKWLNIKVRKGFKYVQCTATQCLFSNKNGFLCAQSLHVAFQIIGSWTSRAKKSAFPLQFAMKLYSPKVLSIQKLGANNLKINLSMNKKIFLVQLLYDNCFSSRLKVQRMLKTFLLRGDIDFRFFSLFSFLISALSTQVSADEDVDPIYGNISWFHFNASSGSSEKEQHLETWQSHHPVTIVVLCVIYGCLSLTAFFGNVLVIWIICKTMI